MLATRVLRAGALVDAASPHLTKLWKSYAYTRNQRIQQLSPFEIDVLGPLFKDIGAKVKHKIEVRARGAAAWRRTPTGRQPTSAALAGRRHARARLLQGGGLRRFTAHPHHGCFSVTPPTPSHARRTTSSMSRPRWPSLLRS